MKQTPKKIRQMCWNKLSFSTHASAKRVAEKHNQRSYLCPICSMWHNTSSAKMPKFVTQEFMEQEIEKALQGQQDKAVKTKDFKAEKKRLGIIILKQSKIIQEAKKELTILKEKLAQNCKV